MPLTHSVDLEADGHYVRAVSVTCGLRSVSDLRADSPAYGTHIEIPAVIELLDLMRAGVVTVEEVRSDLIELATEINQEQDREYERLLENMETAAGVSRALHPSRTDSRWVYAMSSEDEPKVIKIGVASNVKSRMKGIQTGSASRIALLWSTRGGKPLEDHLHERFRRRRLTGEWFDFRRVDNPVKLISEAADDFLADYELAE